MKTNYTLIKTLVLALLFTYNSWSQTIITQWNFNGTSDTTVPGGAISPTASIGSGTAELVGGTTAVFAAGYTASTGLGSTDPIKTSPPNYAWALTNFPTTGTESKKRGAQFNVSTVGYRGIVFTYDHRHSESSSNTYMVQYTADRTAVSPIWNDAQLFTFPPGIKGTTGGDTWRNLRTVDVSSVASLNNNPNIAFRVVSAFDPSKGDYNSSSQFPIVYLPTGTARLDMVTITGIVNLGTNQFESAKNNFKMFPNPSNKEVVQFNEAQDVSVFDILGKLILKAKNTTTIDTKSFRSGVYLVKTKTGITRKLVVR